MGYNNLIVTQTTHRVKKCFGKNSEFLPDFLEKMRSIGYTPQQAAELLRSWNETEGKQHE